MQSVIFDNQSITPSKIICVGRNYVEHIKELNNEVPSEPVIFIKPNSAISDVLKQNERNEIHYEAEICLLIENQQIVAVGFGLDLTKRDLQSQLKQKGLPWERAKAFDGSAVFSEFVPCTLDELPKLSMQLCIDDELVQQANYQLMMYKPQQLVNYISEFMSLEDGDIIMTGTPKGVGRAPRDSVFAGSIKKGDELLIKADFKVD
ncbi:MAG: fumarylacetoacetate hydrolase family protein [Parashewanella sp.]